MEKNNDILENNVNTANFVEDLKISCQNANPSKIVVKGFPHMIKSMNTNAKESMCECLNRTDRTVRQEKQSLYSNALSSDDKHLKKHAVEESQDNFNEHCEQFLKFSLKKEIEAADIDKLYSDGANSSNKSDDFKCHTKSLSKINGPSENNSDYLPLCQSYSKHMRKLTQFQSLESRPIYPNVPYSPYASPYVSPQSDRRRTPLRESRRISIDKSGSFLQLNQYKLLDQIGQGAYGLVKLAYSEEDSTHYAMKILSKRRLLRQAALFRRGPKKTSSPLDRVYHEIAVLKKLDHPNIVKLIEVLDDPVEDALYMVFELVKRGEVLTIPTDKPLSEQRAWSIFRDTLLGLEYLHYQRIIHADLKPGNLLVTELGHVKIADLGVCNEFAGTDATISNGSTAGTPAFRAPETLILGQTTYCGKAADIWALGATLYSLVFGNVPFLANSIPLLYEKIKLEDIEYPITPKISNDLKNCVDLMLIKNPSERITLPKLKENTWVTAGGNYPLPSQEENCRLIEVNDEDMSTVVRSIPKLDTLILIKTMLKNHSFGNPFLKTVSGQASQHSASRLERFVRAGRSNSAPGSYMDNERQQLVENLLPTLTELS